MVVPNSEPYNPVQPTKQWNKVQSLYPSTEEIARSIEGLGLSQGNDEKPSLSDSHYRQNPSQQGMTTHPYALSKQNPVWQGNPPLSIANNVPGQTSQYQQPNYNTPYSDYQQNRVLPMATAGSNFAGVPSSASVMPRTAQTPQMAGQYGSNPPNNAYSIPNNQTVPMSSPNNMPQQQLFTQQQQQLPQQQQLSQLPQQLQQQQQLPSQQVQKLPLKQQPTQPQVFSQQRPAQQFPVQNMTQPQGVPIAQLEPMLPPQQMVVQRPTVPQMVPHSQQNIPGVQIPQQVSTSYQQPPQGNAQPLPNTQGGPQPIPRQPWMPNQAPQTVPYMGNTYPTPTSNYSGNQSSADMKPSNQDINQHKAVSQSYGSYGYSQQPNTLGQQGMSNPIPQGPETYTMSTGQPQPYGMGNSPGYGYKQPNGTNPAPNQPAVGIQQPSSNTGYSSQPSFQPGHVASQGLPYNPSLNWVPPQQPSQGPGQPYARSYQGSPQSYPNQYTNTGSSPSVSYPTQYANNTNLSNKYGQNTQPGGQTLPPLPSFPTKGLPSDVHIMNINKILQQTSAMLPQVEQFRGKRGTVLYLQYTV